MSRLSMGGASLWLALAWWGGCRAPVTSVPRQARGHFCEYPFAGGAAAVLFPEAPRRARAEGASLVDEVWSRRYCNEPEASHKWCAWWSVRLADRRSLTIRARLEEERRCTTDVEIHAPSVPAPAAGFALSCTNHSNPYATSVRVRRISVGDSFLEVMAWEPNRVGYAVGTAFLSSLTFSPASVVRAPRCAAR
jgi:hypothetical protein